MNLAHIHLLLTHFPTIGTIIGIGNHFAAQTIDPNFTHRFGDLKHDKQ